MNDFMEKLAGAGSLSEQARRYWLLDAARKSGQLAVKEQVEVNEFSTADKQPTISQ